MRRFFHLLLLKVQVSDGQCVTTGFKCRDSILKYVTAAHLIEYQI